MVRHEKGWAGCVSRQKEAGDTFTAYRADGRRPAWGVTGGAEEVNSSGLSGIGTLAPDTMQFLFLPASDSSSTLVNFI